MKRCPKCGARNADEAVTCSLCNWRMGEVVDVAGTFEPRLWQKGAQRDRGEIAREARGERPTTHLSPDQPLEPPPRAPQQLQQDLADLNTERHFLVPPIGDPMKLDLQTSSFVF